MSEKLESSIRMAVAGCLTRCRASQAPLTTLAEFADKLSALGWDRDSIHEVEKGVLFELMGRCGRPPNTTYPPSRDDNPRASSRYRRRPPPADHA